MKKIRIFLFHYLKRHCSLLMGYLYLLGTAQLPKHWSQARYCHPRYLFHTDFQPGTLQLLKTQFCKNVTLLRKYTMQSNAGIVKRLQLIACLESDRCQISLFPLKIESLLPHLWIHCHFPRHLGNLRTTSTYGEKSLEEDTTLTVDASKCWYYR